MPNYRPATAKDVGRTDVEVREHHTEQWQRRGALAAVYPDDDYPFIVAIAPPLSTTIPFEFARVPILPEECSHEWEWTREVVDGQQLAYCGKCGEPKPQYSNPPIHCALNSDEQPLSKENFPIRDSKYMSYLADRYFPVHTIRRKLEVGGLAEAEPAILLDGRYYPTEWVKSSPGVLPEQVEVV